jgi:hypothetical protein
LSPGPPVSPHVVGNVKKVIDTLELPVEYLALGTVST